MRMAKLGDLLKPGQLRRTASIINKASSFNDCLTKLSEYFATIANDLDKKGVLPSYLALAVTHSHDRILAQRESKPTQKKKGKQ